MIQDYLDLITSEYANQPDFKGVVTINVSVQDRVQFLLNSMLALFDLDTPPVGDQLDIIGEWVGVSRNVNIPATGIYFSWDGTTADGWDYGTWEGQNQPTTITSLPDDAYLTLIRAKIGANNWDGTTEGAYAVYAAAFPAFQVLIQDFANMSYDIVITGGIVDSLTLALLVGGYIPLKPEGVRINEYIVSVDTNPLFAWDVSNALMAGWDTGSWGREIPAT
jgi:hypothetical protein